MKLEHIISTMHRENTAFLDVMQCVRNVLIVNQCDREGEQTHVQNGNAVRMLCTTERGLSNSRNMLLENARGDVAILGDDDLIYLENYAQIIENAYVRYPEADIIVFRFTQSMTEATRQQFKKEKRLNLLHISKIASVEITFKPESIREKGLSFCPHLGLGAVFGAGEENAFLADALRAGLVIRYVPETICYLQPDPPERVKWQTGFDRDYFIKKGACFYRIYGRLWLFFSAAFILLKKRNIFRTVPVCRALGWMSEGRKQYRKLEKKECS